MIKGSPISQPYLDDLRKHAEEKLRQENANQSAQTDDETANLIQELRKHQIELEIQNEELRITQFELSKARDKYLDLYDFAPIGYFTVSEKGIIVEANNTLAKMLGIERSLLINKPFTNFISTSSQDAYYFFINQLSAGENPQPIELKNKHDKGIEFDARLDIIKVEVPESKSPQFRFSLVDITESNKKTADTLQESEKKYRNLFENILDEVHFWELVRGNNGEIETWRLMDVNPATLKVWNRTRADVIGKTAAEIWPEANATELFMPIIKKIFNEGKPHTWETYFSGTNQTLLMTSVPFGDYFFSTGKDITEHKTHQAHLDKITWLLEQEELGTAHPQQAIYGDVTELNTERTIIDNVGKETLSQMSSDVMALLDTSLAIYEKNGDYAFGSFVSEWCCLMDGASRKLCDTNDNREALDCGRWLCHDDCWNNSASATMESGKPIDIDCVGGIRLYGVPIYAGDEIIGAINMGYGSPPTDEKLLIELADKFKCDVSYIRKAATAFKARPPFLIEIAKKRLHSIALRIGKTVEASRSAKLLKDAEKRNHALLDYSPACHKIIDLDSNLQFMNVMGFKMLKLEITDEHYGKPYPFNFFPKDHRQSLTEGLEKVKESGERVVLEGTACDIERNEFTLLHNLIPVPGDDGALDYITVVSSDITDRKKAENIIKASLNEKETLLQEIHHRVKNNMQIIASLLKLQLNNKDKKDVDSILKENMGRVYSMAAIHESLHNSEKLSEIDFKAYLLKLFQMLSQTYSVDPGKISFQVDTPDLKLAIDQANPLGLVLNELISNSLKYAFPDDQKGSINIKSRLLDEDSVEIIVSDDGMGIPDGFDWQKSESLGLKLVKNLVEKQLGGSIELDNANGTKFTIKFNLESNYK